MIDKIKTVDDVELIFEHINKNNGHSEFVEIVDSKSRIYNFISYCKSDKYFKVKYVDQEIYTDEVKFECVIPTSECQPINQGVNKYYLRLRVIKQLNS